MKCLHCKKELGKGNYNKNTKLHVDCKRPYKAIYLRKWQKENHAKFRSYGTRWMRAQRHGLLVVRYMKTYKTFLNNAEREMKKAERYMEKIQEKM